MVAAGLALRPALSPRAGDRNASGKRWIFPGPNINGSDKEVARALGIASITVRRHLGRARHRLRTVFDRSASRDSRPGH